MKKEEITYEGVVYVLIDIRDNDDYKIDNEFEMCSVCDVKGICNEQSIFSCTSGKIYKKLTNLRKLKINKILND